MRLAQPLIGALSLLAPLLVVLLWLREQRLRHAAAIEFSDPELLDIVAPKRLGFRRHVGVFAVVVCLLLLSAAAARPELVRNVAEESSRVVLVLDTSGSMLAEDVEPNRLAAAETAARAFVKSAPENTEIAVVSYASSAEPIIAPTTDRERLDEAIDRLVAEGGTATGEGIYAGLGLLETNGFTDGPGIGIHKRKGALLVMSDGATNAGRDPERAAEIAKKAGVKVNTVAFGTPDGEIGGEPLAVDEEALKKIAETTGGRFFSATSGDELTEIFASLAASIRRVRRYDSIAEWFALAGGVVLFLGVAFSLRNLGRLP